MTQECRALIIGCGYLGERVGRRLLEGGGTVTATTRSAARATDLRAAGFEVQQVELAAAAGHALWRARYDTVLYAVAPGPGGDARLAFRDGALLALDELAKQPPRRFIYVSTTGVYAQNDGAELDERSPAEPVEERPGLIREAENDLLDAARVRGFPSMVVRLGGIYGPGRSPLTWLARDEMRRRIARRAPGGYMNWVHVDDAVEGLLKASERGRPGEIYLVVDGTPVRRGEFFDFAAEQGGVPALDFSSAGAAAGPSERGKRLTNAKARRELGFAPRYPSYREGLRALAARH